MKATLKLIVSCSFAMNMLACQTTPPEPPPAPVPEIAPVVPPAEVAIVEPAVEPVVDQNLVDYELAIEQLKLDELKTATVTLEQLSTRAPELDYVFTNLGLAYFNQNNYHQAEVAFERAISLNKNDAVAYNHLGIITRMQGDFLKARHSYETAISIDSEYAPAYLNLGILFDIYLQDLKQALAQYEKFQTLTNNEDKTVAGWIVDIKRRLKSG